MVGETWFSPDPIKRDPADRALQDVLHRDFIEKCNRNAVAQAKEIQRQKEKDARLRLWQDDLAAATTDEQRSQLLEKLKEMNRE